MHYYSTSPLGDVRARTLCTKYGIEVDTKHLQKCNLQQCRFTTDFFFLINLQCILESCTSTGLHIMYLLLVYNCVRAGYTEVNMLCLCTLYLPDS